MLNTVHKCHGKSYAIVFDVNEKENFTEVLYQRKKLSERCE